MSLQKTLLIADDQPDIRKMLRVAMGYGKYRLLEAESGDQAMEIVRDEEPDIVLLDVMMPGKLNGIDVCRAIKENARTHASYVVLLTAMGQQQDIAAGLDAGADAYMIKPFSPLRLIQVVEGRARLDQPVRPYGY